MAFYNMVSKFITRAVIASIKRGKRYRIHEQIGSVIKSNRRPPLSQTHKDKRKVWARDNMKIDF